jgi:hypothetical protein
MSAARGRARLSKQVVAERVLRTMPGGTQSRLALCDDGIQYIIKCPNNPQGPNGLANEFIAARLMSAVGLPLPPSRAVKYNFDHKCVFELDHQDILEERACDLHFASELVMPSPGGRLYSFLPSSFISRIENRDMFLGAFVFDIWAGSTDVRQAVYVQNHDTKTFKAVFIDNGHLFGGPHWKFSLKAGTAICLEKDVYANLFNPEAIEAWIFQIETKVSELLPELMKTVPPQWYKGDIDHLLETLLSRARSLRSLFWDEIANLREPLRISLRGIYEISHDPPVFPGRT